MKPPCCGASDLMPRGRTGWRGRAREKKWFRMPEAAIAYARRLAVSLGLLRYDGGRELRSGSHLAAHFVATSR